MKAAERRNEIAQRVLRDGHVAARELADEFRVSSETIRKDLLYLESKNIITKGHGAAVASGVYREQALSRKTAIHAPEKARIAERAISLIPEGGVVLIDAGSTAAKAAQLLSLRTDLTIITNSLAAAQALSDTENHLLVLGGELRTQSQSLVGSWTAQCIGSVQADVALMGCDAFQEEGPCVRSYRELEIKRCMVDRAQMVALLCDASKFGQTGLYRFASFAELSCLITDSGISEEQKADLSRKVDLIVI